MQNFAKLGAIAAAFALLAAPALAEDKVAATVNGVAIPQARIDVQVKDAVGHGAPDTPEVRGQILARAIQMELLTQAAVQKGLDKDAEVAEKVAQTQALARQNVLANAYITDYLNNHPVSEDALRKEYDGIKDDPCMLQYKVAHIVVKTEKEAKAIAAKLRHRGDFAAIAKKESLDKASADNGGELGWITTNGLPEDFTAAIESMKKTGQVSRPVKLGDSWQVFKLLDKRVTPFEDAKAMLMRPLQQQEIKSLIDDLKAKAKIVETK